MDGSAFKIANDSCRLFVESFEQIKRVFRSKLQALGFPAADDRIYFHSSRAAA
jgi:hypothetical protein